tara:strand:+ start:769 stop:1089 length:321 start_codon:yes stop_codon:yes gene_type:complete
MSKLIDKWLKEVKLGYQPQYNSVDRGSHSDVFSASHEKSGITLLVQKKTGMECNYMFQLRVGPNFTGLYTTKKIEGLLEPLGKLIDKRRNYMKPKPRKKKVKDGSE